MIIGRWYAGAPGERLLGSRWLACAGAAIMVLLGISLWMNSNGHGFFRWGTVSSSFFLFSLAVLLVLSLVSLVFAKRAPRLAGALALSGIASFALIPLHYALIGYGSLSFSTSLPFTPWLAGALAVPLLVLCFVASKSFATAMQHEGVGRARSWLYPLLVVLLVIFSAFTLASAPPGARRALLETFVGQMLIAALLAMRAGAPRQSLSPHALRAGNSV